MLLFYKKTHATMNYLKSRIRHFSNSAVNSISEGEGTGKVDQSSHKAKEDVLVTLFKKDVIIYQRMQSRHV